MIKSILLRKIVQEEKQRGVPLDYLKDILKSSFGAFYRFTKILSIFKHQKHLPVSIYVITRLLITKQEKIDSCLQVEKIMARNLGFSDVWIHAVLAENPQDFTDQERIAYDFIKTIMNHNGENELQRSNFIKQFGFDSLVELSLLVAACRSFPTIKLVLGYK